MLHPHKKYAHIQDPTGMIPEDEPVFILRAGDQIAPMVVRYWADRNDHAGGDPAVSQQAKDHADKMERWPKKNLADPTTQLTDEQKMAIINEHISYLPENLTSRAQVRASVSIWAETHRAELAIALDCEVYKVPEKIADYMGFIPNGLVNSADQDIKDFHGMNPENKCPHCGKKLENPMKLGVHIKKRHQS